LTLQADDVRLAFKKALADHLSDKIELKVNGKTMTERVSHSIARARTTKFECLVVKALANKSTSVEVKKEKILRHLSEHAQQAKASAEEWFHKAVMKEVKKIQATPSEKAKPDAKKSPKKAAKR
jgi:hypothetical protein